ncbi:hypothetical protein BRC91_02180 [Halobacteriales archaeon QS_4_62_28]|nr:MAG: hypothetical protein BRC91_02180 [Halobacteriales archaeon QS_4_62_28]
MSVAGHRVEPGRIVVGLLTGIAGLLFVLQPLTGPIALGSVAVHPAALSPVVLATGFTLGAVVFCRQGYWLFAFAHAVFAIALLALLVSVSTGSDLFLLVSVAALVAGSGWLITQA